MRRALILSLLAGLVATATTGFAQPRSGDLVLSALQNDLQAGLVVTVNPARPLAPATLSSGWPGYFDNWVRMAPNNRDVVVARVNAAGWPSTTATALVSVDPSGAATTIATVPECHGFELDHDGRWVVAGRSVQDHVLGADHATGVVTTFSTLPVTTRINEITIDRDPGSMPYVHVSCCLQTTLGPVFTKTDRSGAVVTLIASSTNDPWGSIELDPRTGDYIAGSLAFGLHRVTKAGAVTTLLNWNVNAIKLTNDNFAWLVHSTFQPTVLKFDLAKNVVVQTSGVPMPPNFAFTGIDVYGSRLVTCTQRGRQVTVALQSPDPMHANRPYQLACSFARRPGIPLPNGEQVNLAVDPLLVLSVQGGAPSIFSNFAGTTDPFGNATATVNLPAGLPSGMTFFIGGVIDGAAGLDATNTHWCVAP